MTKLIKLCPAILFLYALTSIAYAAVPGPYAGAGMGDSNLEASNQAEFLTSGSSPGKSSHTDTGFAGRAFAGYNFNHYFGLEAGIARYAQAVYKANTDDLSSSIDDTVNAIDLVAKVYLPFNDRGFNVFALGGMARASNSVHYTNGGVPLAKNVTAPTAGSKTYYKLRPIYGVGAGYDIPRTHLSTDLEFSRVQGWGNVKSNPSAMPSADLVTLNFSYNFD